MSRRIEEILLRKELLRSRCALDRLELRAAVAELRGVRPLGEAARVLWAPRVRSRLIEIAIIAVGSTRLRRVSRWLARGVIAWRAWSLYRALRGTRPTVARPARPGPARSAAPSVPVAGPPQVSAPDAIPPTVG